MSLVTVAELLKNKSSGWAVGAFNVYTLEDSQAVVWAAQEERAPVILQVSEGAIKHAGVEYAAAICRLAGESVDVPVAIQLDHGHSMELAAQCIRWGFTSVMIDGSKLPFDENVALTARVVEAAHASGVSVEGELGLVGGKEDDLTVTDKEAFYTDPVEAERFVKLTGIDTFAPAIGTAHGIYKGEPKLDFARLKEISRRVDVPLVLHGASGLSDDAVRRCIDAGADKINIGTDLKCGALEALKRAFEENPDDFDPRFYLGAKRRAVMEIVRTKLRLFGSSGKASL